LRWIDPGVRLRQSIKDSAAQLRKFSYRGFPTVVCFFDTTAEFHLERVHVAQAMFGRETLHFEVSGDPAHDPRHLGMWHGKRDADEPEQHLDQRGRGLAPTVRVGPDDRPPS
jgi:hypothetical protein